MKTTHTPGPWKYEGRLVGGADRVRVADCHVAERDTYENLANTRLITSAPELLAALTETLRALESHLDETCRDHNLGHRDELCPCNKNEVVRARTAIKKATE